MNLDFIGRTIVSFIFLDMSYSVSTWSEMYQQVVRLLFEIDSTIIYKLIGGDTGLAYHFMDKQGKNMKKILNRT